ADDWPPDGGPQRDIRNGTPPGMSSFAAVKGPEADVEEGGPCPASARPLADPCRDEKGMKKPPEKGWGSSHARSWRSVQTSFFTNTRIPGVGSRKDNLSFRLPTPFSFLFPFSSDPFFTPEHDTLNN